MPQNQNTKMLIGAVVAAALAFAVYYGLIGQQAANNIQSQANQALGSAPASQSQQPVPPAPQNPPVSTPTPAGPVSQNPAQAPHP